LVAEPSLLKQLKPELYYTDTEGNTNAGYPHNPNGSVNDIAGISDNTGHIFALMPHPERFIRADQHPRWTGDDIRGKGDGFKVFSNAVEWVNKL
jgi:phosphoribosylformylglycinamidine synthase